MHNIQNITIRKRLMMIFAVWMVIFICFGIYAITQLRNIGEITKKMHEQPLQLSSSSIEARVNVVKIQKATRDYLLARDQNEAYKELNKIYTIESRVLKNLDTIKTQAALKETKELEEKTRARFLRWKTERDGALALAERGFIEEATSQVKDIFPAYVEEIEALLVQIDRIALGRADEFILQAQNIEAEQRELLTVTIVVISIIFLMIFILTINSILRPITKLKDAMEISINTGALESVHVLGNNEISDMSGYYNILIHKLKRMFWLKDSENKLNQQLSGYASLEDITQKTINYLCRTLSAGKGAFYVYDKNSSLLRLKATFAFTEKERLSESIELGEGIVGQVALERKSILLRNMDKKDAAINTALISEAPLNSYVFPLIYEEELYGVIELASLNQFREEELEFVSGASDNISISLYSALQNEIIKELLKISEEAREEAYRKSEELKSANEIMLKQQEILQTQTAELQQSNAELEEQQQLLQQQSEEIQHTNVVLEEQHRQLEEQTSLLDMQYKRLEEAGRELEKRSQEMERISKYKSEFLANMSHELRTPLNSIILLSKLLINKGKEKLALSDQKKIEVINSSGRELLRLINDVLDLSKIEAGRMSVERELFHSSMASEEAKAMFVSFAKEKGIKLFVKDNLSCNLYGDKYKILQILRNLLSNAIKFTKQGFVELQINKSQQSPQGVNFIVRDTGIGIPDDKKDVIFNQFQQGDGSISRKYGGTGLGLSICKNLAQLMGGQITFTSEEKVGSEFILYIPDLLGIPNFDAVPIRLAEAEAAASLEKDSGEVDEKNKSILVIEDDGNYAEHIKTIVMGMGFNVIIAEKGRMGIEFAVMHRPRGILLDLILPDMNGMDVLRELKSIPELRSIPVHIISVSEKNNKFQKAGALGYHQKPVEENEIIKLVADMISFPDKKPKSILLVEDNKIQQEAIGELINDEDILIKTVDSEKDAIETIGRGTFDVIILDLKLKEGSGLNICKFIVDKNISTPVIVYTGRELTLDEEKELRKVADSIIIKTANSQERLLDEITLFLHKVRKTKKNKYSEVSRINNNYALDLKGKNILLVDDDPRNVFTLASALENYNANIIEADSGETAIRLLKKLQIDLVLMDIMMPNMDGYEAMRKIRQDSKLKHIPIIAVTAKSLKEDRHKCIAAGANDYISKPVDYDNLIRIIKAWIAKEK
jgi:CheY-like chemotaxis protein/putative methionine-R-sulfoxide reductase with GAF domain